MRKICIVFLFWLLCFCAYSQISSGMYNKPEIVPSTPNAQIFERITDVPVSLYNGTAEVKIPLCNITVGKLELPIYLSYSSNGVRVDEMPGMVGTKWRLNFGGMISRSIHGKPDNDDQGWLNVVKLKDFPNMSDLGTMDLMDKIAKGCIDAESDVFNLVLPNSNQRFVFDLDNKPLLVPFRNLKIRNNSNRLESWSIIDEEGNMYAFQTPEWILKYSDSDYIDSRMPYCKPDGSFIVGWMLDTIYSADFADTILIDYQKCFRAVVNKRQISEEFMFDSYTVDGAARTKPPFYINKIYESYVYDIKIPRTIKTRNQTVEFYSSSYQNADLGAKIDSIKVFNSNNSVIKALYFNYNSKNRPQLTSVYEKVKNDLNKAYEFEYSSVELPDCNSLAIDNYGYYNGKNDNSSLVCKNSYNYNMHHKLFQIAGNRDVDTLFNQAGSLVSVRYPTGGMTKFEYETNRVYRGDIAYTIAKDSHFRFTNSEDSNWSQSQLIIEDGVKAVIINNLQLRSKFNAKMILLDGLNNVVKEWRTSLLGVERLYLKPGKYKIHCYLEDILDAGILDVSVLYEIKKRDYEELSGGIRIKQISNYDEFGFCTSRKQYRYNYFNSNKSSGLSNFNNMVFDYSVTLELLDEKTSVDEQFAGPPRVLTPTFPTVSSISRKNMDLNGGGYVGYSEVTELLNDNDGRVEYKYTGLDQFKDKENGKIILYTPNDYYGYKRGLLLYKKEYDKNGCLLKKNSNEYVFNGINNNHSNYKECINFKVAFDKRKYVDGIKNYIWEDYYHTSEWLYLKKTTETYFFKKDSVTNCINYNYDNENHAQITSVLKKNSNGDVFETKYYYPLDKPTGIDTDISTLNKLIDKNMNIVLKLEKKVNGRIIDGQIVNYNIKLLPCSVLNYYNGKYEPILFYDIYNKYSKVLQMHDKTGVVSSFMWDINSIYPVIKGVNIMHNSLLKAVDSVSILKKLNPISLSKNIITAVDKYMWNDFNIELRNKKSLLRGLITTYTYKELVGMTSETDPNGIITFYEYDNHNRLSKILDQESRIINQFSYRFYNDIRPESELSVLSINPVSIWFNSGGGTQQVNVSTNTTWSISTKDSWLSCVKNGNVIMVTAASNGNLEKRTGQVLLSGIGINDPVNLTITQEGNNYFTVDKKKVQFNEKQGVQTITVNSARVWSIKSCSGNFFSALKTNHQSLEIRCTAYTGNLLGRSGSVTLSDGVDLITVNIYQDYDYE